MRDGTDHARKETGGNIVAAIAYVQEVYEETAQLMDILDGLMGYVWESPYGNSVTRGVSADLKKPHAWLARGCYRMYHSAGDPDARTGIVVVYRGYGIEQPILIAGRVAYVSSQGAGANKVGDPWDLRTAWFEEGPEDKKMDGTVYEVDFDDGDVDDRAARAQVFGMPLVRVQSEDDIRALIYDRLVEL